MSQRTKKERREEKKSKKRKQERGVLYQTANFMTFVSILGVQTSRYPKVPSATTK